MVLLSAWYQVTDVLAVPPGFDSETEHVIAWCILDFLFTLKRQHHELAPNVAMRLDACLSIASQIVDEIEVLGKKGTLGIMQDTASCMTSSLGIFFHKASSRIVRVVLANSRCFGLRRQYRNLSWSHSYSES